MKAIYRAAFALKQEASAFDVIDRVASLAWAWVLDPRRAERMGLKCPVQADTSACTVEEREILPGWRVQAHRVDVEARSAWGLRLTHPDGEDPNFEWATEITVATCENAPPFFTCSLLIGDSGNVFIPVRRRPSRPRIVADVLDMIGSSSLFPLLTKPFDLTESELDVSIFLQALTADSRTHPLVLISVNNATQSPLVDHLQVSSRLAGLAHVVLARNSSVSWNLGHDLPRHLNCFHGAVRLYWPRLKLSDPGFWHPLWAPQHIEDLGRNATKEVGLQLLEAIAGVSAFKVPEHFVTWDKLLDMDRRKAIAEAKERSKAHALATGRNNEWAELLEVENASMAAQVRILREQLSSQAEMAEQQRSIADSYRFALQQGRNPITGEAEPELPILPANSVAEAVAQAERDHGAKLVFSFNNKSEEKDSPFEAPEEVERAFNWLATTYWDARAGVAPCPDLDRSVRELIPGWSFSGGQKKHSVGKHESWYQCKWNGKDYWIGEHLGCGTSKRPEETIRIAFAWDEDSKKIVLGFVGQHQRNANT